MRSVSDQRDINPRPFGSLNKIVFGFQIHKSLIESLI